MKAKGDRVLKTALKNEKLTEEQFDMALDMVLLAVAKKGVKLTSENRNLRRVVVDLNQADRLDKTLKWAKAMLKMIFKHSH